MPLKNLSPPEFQNSVTEINKFVDNYRLLIVFISINIIYSELKFFFYLLFTQYKTEEPFQVEALVI